ncbi:MAG: prepilin-type N-terminal cleavage/methylation domain-containing protein [Sedimentisphaerales bacterium]|nr:prepilin-type N-terminal cleavage/methylation domain-containing protein [Sedimentisphaerales bacterium]
MKRRMRKGFTLVEILIVVVILGILAAIVIPQFTNASEEASVNSLRADLQTMRSQIELYKVQHLGQLPTVAAFEAQMTDETDINGGTTGALDYGPYLERIPTNQFVNSDVVAAADAAGVGWVYDAAEGTITAATTDYTGALVLSSY